MKKLLFIGLFILLTSNINSGVEKETPKPKTTLDLIKEQHYKLKDILDKQLEGDIYLVQHKLYNKISFNDKLKIYSYCDSLNIENPVWLYKSIFRESRFNHKAVNKLSLATGLIQWIPSTAIILNMVDISDTTFKTLLDRNIYISEQIKEISFSEQLDYIYKYYKPICKKYNLKSHRDVYLAVLSPISLKKQNNYVLGNKESKIYIQNSYLDLNKDNTITVQEVRSYCM